MYLNLTIAIFSGYFIGSIPTAVWIGKLTHKLDIREHGSGNPGATNVFRVLGWKLGLFVLLVDIAKGFIPVFFLPLFFPVESMGMLYPLLIGTATIAGHIFTIFAGFRGGKGVGTTAGVFAALIPFSFIAALLTFLIVFFTSRYVSFSSIMGALVVILSIPLFQWLNIQNLDVEIWIIVYLICFTIIFKHFDNIKRIRNGEENKIKL